MIQGNNYIKTKLYNNTYKYTAEKGYHFESFGVNYGNVVFGGEDLANMYVIKPNNYEEMVDTNFTNINDTDTDNGES